MQLKMKPFFTIQLGNGPDLVYSSQVLHGANITYVCAFTALTLYWHSLVCSVAQRLLHKCHISQD